MFYVNRFFGVGKWRKWCGNAWFCVCKGWFFDMCLRFSRVVLAVCMLENRVIHSRSGESAV